jgi:hypothetical protein
VKVGTTMAKSRKNRLLKQCKQIEIEMEIRKNAEERLKRRRYTPMTKAQFRYCVMRDLGLLEEYYDNFE